MMDSDTKGHDEASSTLSSSGTQLSSVRKSLNAYSTLEVVRPSDLEAYKNASEAGFEPQWQAKGEAYSTAGPATSEQGSTIPIGSAIPPPPSQEMICGLPKRAFWIIFTVVTSLCVIAIIVGGAVGGTRHQESQSSNDAVGKSTVSSSNPTAFVTVTVGPTSGPTTSLSPSTTTTSSVTKTSACVGGTGAGNYAGLCGFACSYGYCPPGPCTCTTSGTPMPTPATNGIDGVPLKGEDDYDSYLGLCSYCCNHGYCPKSACTTKGA